MSKGQPVTQEEEGLPGNGRGLPDLLTQEEAVEHCK